MWIATCAPYELDGNDIVVASGATEEEAIQNLQVIETRDHDALEETSQPEAWRPAEMSCYNVGRLEDQVLDPIEFYLDPIVLQLRQEIARKIRAIRDATTNGVIPQDECQRQIAALPTTVVAWKWRHTRL